MPNIATATDIRIGNSLATEVRLGSNLVWSRSYDANALAYLNAVEAADGQALETPVKVAINDFVLGLKADDLWSKINTCFLLQGPRTLAGLMVALKGAAATNNFFTLADYNRNMGLKGDGATKYLELNRNNNIEAQNSKHFALVINETGSWSAGVNRAYFGGTLNTGHTLLRQVSATQVQARIHSGGITPDAGFNTNSTGFIGFSRANSTEVVLHRATLANDFSLSETLSPFTSQVPANALMRLFSLGNGLDYSDGRISFLSIGNAIGLSQLRQRVATLRAAINAAI
jgi:hypothetical protein